jgi:hypothetical protein
MLRNTSNLPSTFRIELSWGEDATSTSSSADKYVFSVKPGVGEVDAENFVLICVRFSPRASRKYIQLVRCIINGESGGKVMMEGAGATPFVVLPDLLSESVPYDEQSWGLSGYGGGVPFIPRSFGVFYLKPACLGLSNYAQGHFQERVPSAAAFQARRTASWVSLQWAVSLRLRCGPSGPHSEGAGR